MNAGRKNIIDALRDLIENGITDVLSLATWDRLLKADPRCKDCSYNQVAGVMSYESMRMGGILTKVKSGFYRARTAEDDEEEIEKIETDPMPCGLKCSKCFVGEKCHHAPLFDILRSAGYLTLEEHLSRTDARIVLAANV